MNVDGAVWLVSDYVFMPLDLYNLFTVASFLNDIDDLWNTLWRFSSMLMYQVKGERAKGRNSWKLISFYIGRNSRIPISQRRVRVQIRLGHIFGRNNISFNWDLPCWPFRPVANIVAKWIIVINLLFAKYLPNIKMSHKIADFKWGVRGLYFILCINCDFYDLFTIISVFYVFSIWSMNYIEQKFADNCLV